MGRKKYSKELKARIAGSIMEFNFSTNNSMTEFETPDTTSTIYLGFSSQPGWKGTLFKCRVGCRYPYWDSEGNDYDEDGNLVTK